MKLKKKNKQKTKKKKTIEPYIGAHRETVIAVENWVGI